MVASSSTPQSTADHNERKEAPVLASESILEHAWTSGLGMPIFVIDMSQYVVAWNTRIEEVTKITAQHAMNRPIETILRSDSVALFEAAVKDVQLGKNVTVCNLNFEGGSLARLQVKLCAQRQNRGQILSIACFAQDVVPSETVNSSTPPAAEGALSKIANCVDVPMVGFNSDRVITVWNPRAEKLTGHARHDTTGKSVSDLIPSEKHRERLQTMSDILIQGGSTRPVELGILLKNGDTKPFLFTLSSDKDADGRIVGVCMIITDMSNCMIDHPDILAMEMSDQSERAKALRNGQCTTSDATSQHVKDAVASELRELIENANTPIFGVDTHGRVNEWNKMTTEVTGYSAAECSRRPLVETFIEASLRPSLQAVIDNALRGRGTSNFELEVCTKSNDTRFLLVNATTRRGAENSIMGVVFIAQDVTEACRHDRAVAAMANELRQFIDTANAPIFGIDRDGDVNEWNDKTAEITGFTKEEAFDCSLLETFIVPSMRDSVQEVLDNALEGRGTSNYELEFRTKSNEIRHLLVNATTRRDAENNVVGVVGVAQDVTEAVQRDRAVAGMALELRQLIDTANAPIFGIDIDGNVNEWNRRTSEITGYTKEEAFDEPLVETFIAESMQDKVEEILDSALAGNETSNYELEFVSKSNEPIFLLVNATTRRDPENVVVGVVGVAQDVTEDRKHAQALREMQYLRASQEAKVETERNMTAYFAHELRNPLGAIDSALNAMPDDLPDSARSLIAGMQLCTGFMSSIMNNLLDVRKMEEGKMTLTKSPISLKKLLNNVHKMLLPSVRPGVGFEKVCNTKGKDWVLGDAHRIQQVMTNVITNAIKYTVRGSVTLVMGWEDDNVKFECVDTGPGIPKNEQEKLFQRFVQRGGAPGTGLGLAIAKHLVDLTGGSIRFDSDPTIKAGTNCVVLMSLPLCDAPDTVVEVSTALIQEKISFLIIDDIKMNRMMLKRRIEKGIAPNSVIKEASTGEEALEICGMDKFDVIVVDQYMEEAGGVMVGTDVVFAMRRMRINSVIIGCSGNDMGTQFFEAGADWVWQKPMPSNAKIIQDLRASLNKRASRQ
eukprot:CAMPEP_0116998306 /NCGR_PEP_ID=MMETSP0472-20121206/1425_1 /TAXON_ID=693140 ORGANISM="Tiarina fusus, Strain LIS" /NCGR_SAMPLE_ID=MMETSP0472 /ASSEMBLY_ACC=CAM_ASM_000603 /LENGTH=1067 /DNA_ID=CAMNT_0004697421 /DNA_START=41 /DNA_END=3244 /DNA_ORIENTATION=-